jgi:mono/diheme cytochrome c family protein
MVPGGVTTTSPDAGPTTTMLGSDDPLLALGKEVFEVTAGGLGCAFCHGSDGLGTVYGPRIAGRSKEDISNALRWADGMTDITLTPDELEGVARYVRTLP